MWSDAIASDQPALLRRAYALSVPDAPLEEVPRFIAPMLAAGGLAPIGVAWAMEVKWDGSLDSRELYQLIHSVRTQAYGLIRGRGPAHLGPLLRE